MNINETAADVTESIMTALYNAKDNAFTNLSVPTDDALNTVFLTINKDSDGHNDCLPYWSLDINFYRGGTAGVLNVSLGTEETAEEAAFQASCDDILKENVLDFVKMIIEERQQGCFAA